MKETENIKNPNQLDMFAGILFTPEQEKMIVDFIQNQKDHTLNASRKNNLNEALLTNNGFVKGVDFINTFQTKIVTREVTLGFSWKENQFKTEQTYETIDGCISLKGKRFNSYQKPNELLNDDVFRVDFNGDKIQCEAVQDQYRYIKPKTLLEKLKIFNSRQVQLFEEYKKKNNLKQNVIEKYTKLYPNALITVKSEWSSINSSTFEIIEVNFESGSYIQFKLDTFNNKEFIYKKHDDEYNKLNSDELLERFSKQIKKEASN
jgi:hypothetical protein